MINGLALLLIAAIVLAGGTLVIALAAIARDPLLPCRALHTLAATAARFAANAARIASALDAFAQDYIEAEASMPCASRAHRSETAFRAAENNRKLQCGQPVDPIETHHDLQADWAQRPWTKPKGVRP